MLIRRRLEPLKGKSGSAPTSALTMELSSCLIVAPLIIALAVGGQTAFAAVEAPKPAAPAADEGRTPPRLSLIEGAASFWRPGAADWVAARLNTPLEPGDTLYTAAGARLEIQIGAHTFVRSGEETELGIESQEPDFLQLKVTSGHVAVDLRPLEPGHTVEIDTPAAALSIEQSGYYRVDVAEDRSTFTARRGGRATVTPGGGEGTVLTPADQVVVGGGDTPRLTTATPPEMDAWDRWNYDRTDHILGAASRNYLPPDVSGADTLDHYGDWRMTPNYGPVWAPRDEPADWAPYSTGQWVWDPYYGWTWVDDAPWGWAPYHYGRWVYDNDYWAWAPGPIAGPPPYAPALVAFFGFGGVSVGFGLPFVSWAALGWGEPCIPWWGPVGFVGVTWWGGWFGPHHHHHDGSFGVHDFHNAHVGHGLVTVNRDHFGHGRIERAPFAGLDTHRMQFLRNGPAVKPGAHSLAPAGRSVQGHVFRPPAAALTKGVVATRPPQSTAGRLAAAGLHAGATNAPAARLVSPSHPPSAGHMTGRTTAFGANVSGGHIEPLSGAGRQAATLGGARPPSTARSSRWPAPPPPPHASFAPSHGSVQGGRYGTLSMATQGRTSTGAGRGPLPSTPRFAPPPRPQARGGWGWASPGADRTRADSATDQRMAAPPPRSFADVPRSGAGGGFTAVQPRSLPAPRPQAPAMEAPRAQVPRTQAYSGGRGAVGRMNAPRQQWSGTSHFNFGGGHSSGGSHGRGR